MRHLCISLLLALALLGAWAQNPIAEHYKDQPAVVPAWVGQLPWQKVVTITDMPGADDDARLAEAQKAVVAQGGGVIRFPAGTYTFKGDIQLEDGVILQGETPKEVLDAKDEHYTLITRFEFPKYQYSAEGNGTPIDTAFKCITVKDAKASNLGVAYIAINRGRIFFSEDAEHKTGVNRFVFGCIFTNAAAADASVPNVDYGQLPHQRWTARHTAAIHVYASENLFVANNRLPKSADDNFLMKPYRLVKVQGSGQDFNIKAPKKKYDFFTIEEGVEFDYDNRPGIYANSFGIGTFGGELPNGTPETHPFGFRKGTIIRDNYIYCSGRCAIAFAGDGVYAGFNVVRYPQGLVRPTTTGLVVSDGSATNDNRCMTMRGYRWYIEGNDYEVYSNQAYGGKVKINDGEGIMHENHSNSAVVEGKIINNTGNRYLCLWIMNIDGLLIKGNKITAGGNAIHILSDRRKVRNLSIVDNELTAGNIAVTTLDGDNIVVANNKFTGQGEGTITVSNPEWATHDWAKENVGFKIVKPAPRK